MSYCPTNTQKKEKKDRGHCRKLICSSEGEMKGIKATEM